MDAPQTEQATESTEDLIAAEFDRLDAESGDEIPETSTDNDDFDASAEEETETVEVEEPEGKEEPSQELKEEVQDAADSDYSEPAPERWSKEMQEMYNGLPPVARKNLLEGIYKPMQRSYTEATQQLAGARKQLTPMMDALQQYRPQLESKGINPEEAFRTQLAWSAHIAEVGAEQGLKDMAQAYGVGVNNSAPSGGQEEYLTPTERAFKAQIDDLKKQVTGQQKTFEQMTNAEQQRHIQAQHQEVQQNLTTFINEKTEDGKLAHPHMEKVANNVAGIIRGGLVKKVDDYGQPVPIKTQLSQAYSMACNLDPSIRTPVSDPRQAQRVKSAANAQVVTKTPAGQVNITDDIPMDKFIEDQWERLNRQSA